MIKGYLFDLDGVLIDSEEQYTRIWGAIEKQFPTGIHDFPQVIKGTTLHNILDTHFAKTDHPAIRRMLHEMEGRMEYHWCPMAHELLQLMIEEGIPKALVTSSDKKKMSHLFRDLPEIEGMFETIIDADCVTRSKPDPEGYLKAAQRLNLSPSECVVVEDSLQGLRAGRSAGCTVYAVAGTWPAEVLAPEADKVISSMQELYDEIHPKK